MKNICKIIIFILILMNIFAVYCLADTTFDIKLISDSEKILKDQSEVVLYLSLQDYTKDGILGYEASIEYDNTVFESIVMEGLNGWIHQIMMKLLINLFQQQRQQKQILILQKLR